MKEEASYLFNQGTNSYLWTVLAMEESSDDLFHSQIRDAFFQWIEAITNVLIAAGVNKILARQRGEDAMTAIQGALILSHSLRDYASFQHVIK